MQKLTSIQIFCVTILPFIFAVTGHEVAHGLVAYFLGDKTARNLGRLSLNPLRHLDVFGTLVVPLLLYVSGAPIIGWARPVPIDVRKLKNIRRDYSLITLAGPLANGLMAIFWALIAKIGWVFILRGITGAQAIFYMGIVGVELNLFFMLFNLVPIPPLDGGHLLMNVLPYRLGVYLQRLEFWGMFIVLLLFTSAKGLHCLVPMVQIGKRFLLGNLLHIIPF